MRLMTCKKIIDPLRKVLNIVAVLFILFIFICYIMSIPINSLKNFNWSEHFSSKYDFSIIKSIQLTKYLIKTSTCVIPDVDPFNAEIIKYFHRFKYKKCAQKGLLTYVEKKNDSVILHVNQSLLSSYSFRDISCCYSVITRPPYQETRSEELVRFSTCKTFSERVNITDLFIKVTCTTSLGKEVYANVHACMTLNSALRKRREEKPTKQNNTFSVLLIGIDSISKLNLIRTMPKTHKFLEKNSNYINLKGYTKIDDNTFPNLMAILTGYNDKEIYKKCRPNTEKLDNCNINILWNTFRDLGYVTAYGEDESKISTFNYIKAGFAKPPTDYYFRPYVMATEKLPSRKINEMYYCSGPEIAGERILNLAKDFTKTFRNYPSFSLFWMNTFSHENVNGASMMDEKVEQFLHDISSELNDTIFIFFSDHGFRFGKLRYTHTGWLEERLPFIYVHIPNSFKERFHREYENIEINSRRLTSPYDVYMTLQDILYYANDSYKIEKSSACEKCQSLFKEMYENRTCRDASIDQKWCMCTSLTYINPKKSVVELIANFILSKINKIIRTHILCAHYELSKIVSAGKTGKIINKKNETARNFVVVIETQPISIFEATVEFFFNISKPVFRLLGKISRIDKYDNRSSCIEDAELKKYCFCTTLLS